MFVEKCVQLLENMTGEREKKLFRTFRINANKIYWEKLTRVVGRGVTSKQASEVQNKVIFLVTYANDVTAFDWQQRNKPLQRKMKGKVDLVRLLAS